jgi:hypothetical protein
MLPSHSKNTLGDWLDEQSFSGRMAYCRGSTCVQVRSVVGFNQT